jgi:hypothetical protein
MTSIPDDLTSFAKEQIKERFASPILSAFAVSWSLWNYKFIVILLSAESVKKTFELINSQCYPDSWDKFIYGIMLPSISALIYIFIYPFPARFVNNFKLRQQRIDNAEKQKILDEQLLTREESKIILSENRRLSIKLEEEVRKWELEKLELMTALKEAPQIDRNVPTLPELSQDHKVVLFILGKIDTPLKIDEIIRKSPFEDARTRYIVNDLVEKGLLSKSLSGVKLLQPGLKIYLGLSDADKAHAMEKAHGRNAK